MTDNKKQTIVALDAEGVILPEIWIAVAEATGIAELTRTTRDEPDYDILMKSRLAILDKHGITIDKIQAVIAELTPLDGAKAFLDELRSITQLVILSDTFEQFAQPLVKQLDWPTIFCHQLHIEGKRIADYQLRIADPKRKAVKAFQSLNYTVIAAGDSYNDTTMLEAADTGFLFRAPANVQQEFEHLPHYESYSDLLSAIKENI